MRFFKEIHLMFESIKKDYHLGIESDPSLKSKWDLILFSSSFHGLILYRISHMFWNLKLRFLAMFFRGAARVFYAMDIHPAADIEPGIFIDHGIGVVIGETASVGSGTLIYHGVTLGSSHITKGKRHPSIGRNVFIGANASILGPIKICDGAKIGANSVVIHNVPCACTVVGNPAKIVRANKTKRRDDAI